MEETKQSRKFIEWRPNDKGDAMAWSLTLIWGTLIILGGWLELGEKFTWWNP